ncbi:MAG TPA: DUF1223 domain-containing protein [Caulobacteraceae bacterium]|jgi:hypothetical protein|nr:DUF1223 domain-containing protein [Caulobacteraceae bacterium]
MRLPAPLIAALLIFPIAGSATARAVRHHARHGATRPVVVELYTAQGCADCPAANQLIIKLSDQPDVIALTFPVDYWDYLGWRDAWAKPEFSERQHAYMKAMKLRDVYTPQVVVDGRAQMSGLKSEEVAAAIKAAARVPEPRPQITMRSLSWAVVGGGRTSAGGADVWLVRYAPEIREVEVKTGENKGKQIREADVVRELVKLGPWRGASHAYKLPKVSDPALKSVILVQSAKTGRILASRRL